MFCPFLLFAWRKFLLKTRREAYRKYWYMLVQLQLAWQARWEAPEDPICFWKWNVGLALLCGFTNVIPQKMHLNMRYLNLVGCLSACTLFSSKSASLKLRRARKSYVWNTSFQRHGGVGDCWLRWDKAACPEQREGALSYVLECEVLFPVLLCGKWFS